MLLIENARVFDGDSDIGIASVLVDGESIATIGDTITAPGGAEIVDARGMTLIPGLIDAHTHPQPPALEEAIKFGVTTELDMFCPPQVMDPQRAQARTRNDLADVRSATIGASVSGSHATELMNALYRFDTPTVENVDDVAEFVATRVVEGADYIKLIIDDGSALGHPKPTLTPELTAAVVAEAHRHNKLAIAHIMTIDGARQAVDAGVDGLAHIFMDAPPTEDIVAAIAEADVFVIATLSILGALAGDISGEQLAYDTRVAPLVSDDWRKNLCTCRPHHGPGRLEHALAATRALHQAGVTILAGTDTAVVGVPGTAHGVSLHGELGLLVRAGLTPVEALRSATSRPARCFGLTDRGRLQPGRQADLVMINGDPTTHIDDTLSISAVWRRGHRANRNPL